TSCFLGNAPGAAVLRGCDATGTGPDAAEWFDLLPRTPLQPDTRHRFRLGRSRLGTHVRLEIHPDGGMARLRLFAALAARARRARCRAAAAAAPAAPGLPWLDRLPADHAAAVLTADSRVTGQPAADLAAGRPYTDPARLESLLSGGKLPGLGAAAAARVRALILG